VECNAGVALAMAIGDAPRNDALSCTQRPPPPQRCIRIRLSVTKAIIIYQSCTCVGYHNAAISGSNYVLYTYSQIRGIYLKTFWQSFLVKITLGQIYMTLPLTARSIWNEI